MSMPFDHLGSLRAVPMTLYTEMLVVRGTIQTLQHRVTDILNQATEPHLVLEDVTLEEYGSTDLPLRAEFAQVNLASVLFAVSLTTVEPIRELRTPKVSERALLSVPPFRSRRPGPSPARARPARQPVGAPRRLHPGDRRHVLVRAGRRDPADGRLRRREPRPGPGLRAVPRGRSVGRRRPRHASHARSRSPPNGGLTVRGRPARPQSPRSALPHRSPRRHRRLRTRLPVRSAISGQRTPSGAAEGCGTSVIVVTGRTGSAWQRAQ